jgi:UDP-glucose 4-epimerase
MTVIIPEIVLVTGASGFIGRALVKMLSSINDCTVRSAVRRSVLESGNSENFVVTGDLLPNTNWTSALTGVGVVVHTAARVHAMASSAERTQPEYQIANVEGTINLAKQAAAMGVKRFVFISSAKVLGERSHVSMALVEGDEYLPHDDYAKSKTAAELGLVAVSEISGMELVIVRPPVVYGAGVRSNFRMLMKAVSRGLPLPFGMVTNRRSLIALDNLVDFIATCVTHPAAANQIFMVSDGEDLSTPDLVRRIALAMGRPARLFPFPVEWLRVGATIVSRGETYQRLCGNLQLNISKAHRMLNWTPSTTVEEGLRKAVAGLD